MDRQSIDKRGFTTIELVVVVVIIIVLILLLLPVLQSSRGGDSLFRGQRRNSLKQIGLALHNYHDDYGAFPPAYVADENGRRLHSWRVLILPYLGEQQAQELYEQYDFSEPWNGPNNVKLLTQRPNIYRGPGQQGDTTMTAYAAIVGEPCVLQGTEPVAIKDIRDGTSNTLVAGEAVGAGIPWTKPQDVDFDQFTHWGDANGFSGGFPVGGAYMLSADGSVHFLSDEAPDKELARSMFTRAGGD
ncbi:hypothetical protein Mal52_57830 [Symmachiella dynata]|uniref:DUF1559 domain-containing protein n=1 Tax=Symmachiella dynata TaxID=2527995 RepID=A0A517ZXT0_9PLAN|nr:DUF1559 domain-containing protein [Symmachiella dynata]QDU47255.1 hypothetical protein Mal52_57830 [Symmachiella dynata]